VDLLDILEKKLYTQGLCSVDIPFGISSCLKKILGYRFPYIAYNIKSK